MRTISIVIAILTLLLAVTSWAQETQTANEIDKQWRAEREDCDQRQEKLDALMGTMVVEMQANRIVDNRKEREGLMSKHRCTMREAMHLTRDMDGAAICGVMAEHLGTGTAPSTDSNRPQHLHEHMTIARKTNKRQRRVAPNATQEQWP